MNRNSPLIVAVSGTSGAGKSSLVAGLSRELRKLALRVETLHFDDFTDESDLPDSDVAGWLARGGRPGEWHTEELERRLLALLTGSPDPWDSTPALVVVVEEPFGRARSPFDRLVDLSIHIRVPLHVALARRLLRQFVPPVGGLDETSAANLRLYLARYLDYGAQFYQVVETAAEEGADLILDGLQDRTLLEIEAVAEVARRLDEVRA